MFFLVLYYFSTPLILNQSFSSAFRGQQVQLLSLILFKPLHIRGLKNDKLCTLGFPFPRPSNFSLPRIFFKLLDSVYALAPTQPPQHAHTHTHTQYAHTGQKGLWFIVSSEKSSSHAPTLCRSRRLYSPLNYPGQNTGCRSFLRGSSQPQRLGQVYRIGRILQ